MEKDIVEVKDSGEVASVEENQFKGYSMDELKYQRALLVLKKDYSKRKVLNGANELWNRSLFGQRSSTSKMVMIQGLASRLLSGLGYLDYAMLGVSLFGTGRKIYKFFRRRK